MKSLICDICRSEDWTELYKKQVLHPLWWLTEKPGNMLLKYVICKNCGYITLSPRLSFEEYQDYYRLSPTPSRDAFGKRDKLLGERKNFISKNFIEAEFDLAIEVGPAYGDFLLRLTEFRNRVGIEPSRDYCQSVADAGRPFVYHCCMLEQVPEQYPELRDSADLVVAAHVLEHAHQPRSFLQDLISLAKPGGLIYIEVPSVEAMSELRDSAAQTIHFGHISQFCVEVLNQLCVSEALEVVSNEVSAAEKYPLLRGLYQKPRRVATIAEQFRRHAGFNDIQAIQAKKVLVELLESSNKSLVLWGCGDDLFDILQSLNPPEQAKLAKRAKLVDMNPGKQGKSFAGLDVCDPVVLHASSVEKVLICSRSKLIQSDIRKAATELFRDIESIALFP